MEDEDKCPTCKKTFCECTCSCDCKECERDNLCNYTSLDLMFPDIHLSTHKETHVFEWQLDGTWIIKIDKEGIKFNREAFPDYKPDDFAEKFMHIMEQNFAVKFYKKIDE